MSAEPTLKADDQTIVIRQTQFDSLVELRHRVLRASLPRESAMFEGDGLPTSRHYGAFLDALNIGCASFHLNSWKGQPAWQLRGMATDPGWVGHGVGRAVLNFAVTDLIAESNLDRFWCNARQIAVPFYEKMNWEIASELFEIPTAGPHYRMLRRPVN